MAKKKNNKKKILLRALADIHAASEIEGRKMSREENGVERERKEMF